MGPFSFPLTGEAGVNPTANDSFWVKWRTLVGLNSYPMTDYETVLLAHANGASRVLEGPLLEEGDRFREAGARSCVKNTNTTAPARKIVAVIRRPEIRLGGRTNRERAAGGIGPRRPRPACARCEPRRRWRRRRVAKEREKGGGWGVEQKNAE